MWRKVKNEYSGYHTYTTRPIICFIIRFIKKKRNIGKALSREWEGNRAESESPFSTHSGLSLFFPPSVVVMYTSVPSSVESLDGRRSFEMYSPYTPSACCRPFYPITPVTFYSRFYTRAEGRKERRRSSNIIVLEVK
jgi:hypothetical protein